MAKARGFVRLERKAERPGEGGAASPSTAALPQVLGCSPRASHPGRGRGNPGALPPPARRDRSGRYLPKGEDKAPVRPRSVAPPRALPGMRRCRGRHRYLPRSPDQPSDNPVFPEF